MCPQVHPVVGSDPCKYLLLPPEATKQLNYFDYFCFPHDYLLSKQDLSQTYKNYQRVLHPDKFSSSAPLLDEATRMSSFTSSVYQVLMDDILRAEYLLRTDYNIVSMDESKRETNAQLA